MNPGLKSALAVIAGAVVGSVINGALISISPSVIPPPEGVNLTTEEGLKAGMALMEPKHFLMPWLAHALGTYAGALLALLISKKAISAWIVAGIFFIGGAMMVRMVPSPLWFTLCDLVLAYFPMSWLAIRLVQKNK